MPLWFYPRPGPDCPSCGAETCALQLGRVMLWDCRCGWQHVGPHLCADDEWMQPEEELARELRRAAVMAPRA